VFKLFIFIEELDRNVAICFLQDRRAALIQGLDLVDDCMVKSAKKLVVVVDCLWVGGDFNQLSMASPSSLTESSPEYAAADLNVFVSQMS